MATPQKKTWRARLANWLGIGGVYCTVCGAAGDDEHRPGCWVPAALDLPETSPVETHLPSEGGVR